MREIRYLAPRYLQASPAQKTLLLDSFVKCTGYTRKYAIELLNHGEHVQETIQRRRLPQYRPAVQQALFLAWKATHYVCAKRLLPSLPTLLMLLEQHGHLQLTEEERRQLLTMNVSTAERFLRTQHKPRLTPAWEPAVPEAQDRLLLTDRRHPLTKNSLTLLFKRLSQRAGFTRTPICPSMLRDTYAIRFLQAGGGLAALRERLGVADLAAVKRYQRCCEQRKEERQAQAFPEESMPTRQSQRGKRRRRQGRRPALNAAPSTR